MAELCENLVGTNHSYPDVNEAQRRSNQENGTIQTGDKQTNTKQWTANFPQWPIYNCLFHLEKTQGWKFHDTTGKFTVKKTGVTVRFKNFRSRQFQKLPKFLANSESFWGWL